MLIKQTQLDGQTSAQGRPQGQARRTRQYALQQPDGHTQQAKAEELFDAVHPGAGFGQQRVTKNRHQQQWQAHAKSQGEQSCCTSQGIAGGADIHQGAGQWCGNAG